MSRNTWNNCTWWRLAGVRSVGAAVKWFLCIAPLQLRVSHINLCLLKYPQWCQISTGGIIIWVWVTGSVGWAKGGVEDMWTADTSCSSCSSSTSNIRNIVAEIEQTGPRSSEMIGIMTISGLAKYTTANELGWFWYICRCWGLPDRGAVAPGRGQHRLHSWPGQTVIRGAGKYRPRWAISDSFPSPSLSVQLPPLLSVCLCVCVSLSPFLRLDVISRTTEAVGKACFHRQLTKLFSQSRGERLASATKTKHPSLRS